MELNYSIIFSKNAKRDMRRIAEYDGGKHVKLICMRTMMLQASIEGYYVINMQSFIKLKAIMLLL